MSGKFEIEYFTGISSGPRYVVDVDSGEIQRDESFMSGTAAISDDARYPGTPDSIVDQEVVEEAYQKIIESGIETGEFYEEVAAPDGRGVRVKVFEEDRAEDLQRVDEVDERYIEEAVEELDQMF